MNPAKCNECNDIDFLISTPRVYSCTEAARVQPDQPNPPAPDALTRLLYRLDATPAQLWAEAQPLVRRRSGLLIIDDSTLEKPYARQMALVSRHWSGKPHAVVQGINLLSLRWTDGDSHIPCDYRLYHKAQDQLTKNDHFLALVHAAQGRGLWHSLRTGLSWFELKMHIIREAVRAYLTQPMYTLAATA